MQVGRGVLIGQSACRLLMLTGEEIDITCAGTSGRSHCYTTFKNWSMRMNVKRMEQKIFLKGIVLSGQADIVAAVRIQPPQFLPLQEKWPKPANSRVEKKFRFVQDSL